MSVEQRFRQMRGAQRLAAFMGGSRGADVWLYASVQWKLLQRHIRRPV